MSNEEIKTFITTFKSYMERASVSELNYLRRESNRKYRVEQRFTTGWGVVDERAIKLTKDEARKVLENLLKEGVNPDEIRAIPD